MKLKQLIEQANRKCEMRWRVLAFDPEQDNKLVDEYKDFECFNQANIKKRELLEKNPKLVVQVMSESAQKNEAFNSGDKVSVKRYDKAGNQSIVLRGAKIIKKITEKEAGKLDPMYAFTRPSGTTEYYLVKLATGAQIPAPASDIKAESMQKNEASKEIKVGNQRFYTTNDNGIIFVRKIAPYDDADYYYAVYDPQKVRLVFTQSGGKNKQASMVKYNDTAKQIEEIAKKLIELNKHIQPKMTHESAQKNESIEEQQDAIAKKIADAVSAKFGWVLSKEGPYEEYYIGKGLNPINVKIKNDKDLQVQLRASAQPKAFKSVKDAIDFIKSNMNAYGFPGASAFYGKLQSKANKNVERQKARDTYLHDISDSAQINETRGYKVIVELGVPDNMNNRDIEDEVERLLRASRKITVVMDVTAERT